MDFDKLKLKRQHRNKQSNRAIHVCGMDTETKAAGPDAGKVQLIAAETGDYIHPTSFEDLMVFFLNRNFRGKKLAFYNLQYDIQAVLKWMDIYPVMKGEKPPMRLNYWIATQGGLKPNDRTFSGELRRIMLVNRRT